ncbi:MAG: glutathione S-transferase family protein [Alphaproteobacteria bacterium]|nr:glutathione S-transferase family protein [Alphaproteobacteria bacterium]
MSDSKMIKVYSFPPSANPYKVRLFLSLLGLDFEIEPVDLTEGEHKSPEFLSINPFGQVPVLVDGDVTVSDSQACLVYLARKYGGEDWLPNDPAAEAVVAEWLSRAANEIHNGPWLTRFATMRPGRVSLPMEMLHERCHAILKLMDGRLGSQDWLALADRPTVADVAIFAIVSLLGDAKIDTKAYANVDAWLGRMRQLPGAIALDGSSLAA